MLHFTCVYLSTHISFLSVDMTFLKSCRCLRSTLCEIQKKQKKKEQQHILSVRESGAYFLVCAGKHDAAAAPLAVTGSTSKSLLKAELQFSTDSFNSVWIQHDWKWQHILLLALKLKVKHRRVESLCGIQRRRRGGGSADPPLFALDVDAWGGCSTFPSKRLKTQAWVCFWLHAELFSLTQTCSYKKALSAWNTSPHKPTTQPPYWPHSVTGSPLSLGHSPPIHPARKSSNWKLCAFCIFTSVPLLPLLVCVQAWVSGLSSVSQ